jgi:outer membrane protein assembly factor BamB
MKITLKRLCQLLGLTIIFTIYPQKYSTQAQSTPDPISQAVHYRGDAQRTGLFDAKGVPQLTGVAWQHNIGEAGYSSPVYADGIIYLGTNRGEVLALDASTGEERWAFKNVGGNASAVAVSGDVVYVGLGIVKDQGMGLYALDKQTGKQLWAFKTDSPIWLSSPLIYNDMAYFGDQNGVFYAVNLKTHQKAWRANVRRIILGHAAADDGTVYFTAANAMFAVDAKTGEQRWQISIRGDWTPHAVKDGVIFAGDVLNRFYALSAQNGKQIWVFPDELTERGEWSAPAIGDGVVYAGDRVGYMYAFEASTGNQVWKFKAEAPPTSDPAIANGVLYFGVGSHGNEKADQDKRYFYALDIKTGQELWKFKAKGEVFNGALVADSSVYFLTAASTLYALH